MEVTPTPDVPVVAPGTRRILLRLPNWLGDVVMAAPAVAAIAAARPDAHLIAQVRPAFASLAARLPGVARVVPAGADRGPGGLWTSRRRLRALDLDAAVIFPRSARARLAPWLARVPVRVGFAADRGASLLTHPVAGWRPLRRGHRSVFYGALARAFGAEPGGPWRLVAPPEALAAADALLADLGHVPGRRIVALEAGASYGPAKCWPAARFGELARRLRAEAGVDVVTVGNAQNRAREEEVAALAGPGLLRAAGRTPDLLALVGLLARADLVVSNDTGPMHVAAAVATPVLALFGATDPVVSGPIGTGPRRLVHEPAPCSPCFLRVCTVAGHPCLAPIGVDRVLAEARAMLASS